MAGSRLADALEAAGQPTRAAAVREEVRVAEAARPGARQARSASAPAT
jgi:hypothetical protein